MFRTLLPLLSLVGAGGAAVGISGMGTSQLASEVIPKLSPERYVAMVCFRVKPHRFNAFESVRCALLCLHTARWVLAVACGRRWVATRVHPPPLPRAPSLPPVANMAQLPKQ